MTSHMKCHAYWLVQGRIPYDDKDTLFATLTPCDKQEAERQFREAMIAAEFDAGHSLDELRRRMDNITSDEPLTEGVIVTSFASSKSPIDLY